MAENERDSGNFLSGLFIGGLLGLLAAIFFAPKSGEELRSDIKDARMKAKAIIEEATYQAKELKKEAERHLSETRQKAKEILACGEKKETEVS